MKLNLSKLKKVGEEATNGPWVHRPGGVVQSKSKIIFWDDEPNQGDTHEGIKPNYEFIATSRNHWSAMIEALEEAIEMANYWKQFQHKVEYRGKFGSDEIWPMSGAIKIKNPANKFLERFEEPEEV